jgi:hypothetical protein
MKIKPPSRGVDVPHLSAVEKLTAIEWDFETTSMQNCEAIPRRAHRLFKAHRLLYHSILGLISTKNTEEET